MHSKKEFDLIVTGLLKKYGCKTICMKHYYPSKIPPFLDEDVKFTSLMKSPQYMESQKKYNNLHAKAKCRVEVVASRVLNIANEKYDCIILPQGCFHCLGDTPQNLTDDGVVIIAVETYLPDPYRFDIKEVIRTPNYLFVVLGKKKNATHNISMTLASTILNEYEEFGVKALEMIESNPMYNVMVTEEMYKANSESLEPGDYLKVSLPEIDGMEVVSLEGVISPFRGTYQDMSLMDPQKIPVINCEFLLTGDFSNVQPYGRPLTARDIPEEDSYDQIYEMSELNCDTLIYFPNNCKFFYFSPKAGPAYIHVTDDVYIIDVSKINPDYLFAELHKEYVIKQIKRFGKGGAIISNSAEWRNRGYMRFKDRNKTLRRLNNGRGDIVKMQNICSLLIYVPTNDENLLKQERQFLRDRNLHVHDYIKQLDMTISHDGCLGSNEIIGNRYRVNKVIDNGGFAKVYKVQDEETSATLAMKELFPKDICHRKPLSGDVGVSSKENYEYDHYKDIFFGEFKMMKTVSEGNANIPQVYGDVIKQNNSCYYIMDFVDNGTLLKRLDDTYRPLALEEALDIFVKLAICTHKVHAMDHYHMDITPSNIMFKGKEMTPMLVDFGNARSYDKERQTIIHKSMIAHTEYYAPPEQNNQGGYINMIACDVYGLGACLYFMLTFEHPGPRNYHYDDSFMAYIHDNLQEHNVPEGVINVIRKSMAYRAKDRYCSMKDMLVDLSDYLSEEDKNIVDGLDDVDYMHAMIV